MFKVLLSDSAKRDLRNNVDWWSEHRSPHLAERWYVAILESIYSLQRNPKRCVLACESEKLGIELHNLWFGLSSKQTHRVLFTVEGKRVNVLRVLSARQDSSSLDLHPQE